MWPFKRTFAQPKGAHDEEPECDNLAAINEYHDEERKFLRAGDRTAAMIMNHHREVEADKFMKEHDCIVTYDTRTDRWRIWRGEWH